MRGNRQKSANCKNSRKEVTIMQYEKPEMVALASAASAIQGGKGMSPNSDHPQFVTTAAYEADE
jgi:hypothetical protein